MAVPDFIQQLRRSIGHDLLWLPGCTAVVLHLSNRNLEITQPVIAAARRLGAAEMHQLYIESRGGAEMAEASAEVVILSPTEAGLAEFRADPRWRTVGEIEVRPWTDDYVNLFGALIREIQTR